MIYTSNLPCDQDMIHALGSIAFPATGLFTDVCFSSIDEKLITVERKKIGDMVSCILSGRFLFQMQKCKEAGSDYLFLILEGRYRRNSDDGVLEVPVWGINSHGNHAEIWKPVQPAMMFSRFDQYLTEIQRDAGIIFKHTENIRGTADTILALYQNFQTPLGQHHSLHQIFKPPTPTVQLVRPSLLRRVVSELPGIGWERSGAVAQHFGSITKMVNAGVLEWENITTVDSKGKSRRIGRKIAEKIMLSFV